MIIVFHLEGTYNYKSVCGCHGPPRTNHQIGISLKNEKVQIHWLQLLAKRKSSYALCKVLKTGDTHSEISTPKSSPHHRVVGQLSSLPDQVSHVQNVICCSKTMWHVFQMTQDNSQTPQHGSRNAT